MLTEPTRPYFVRRMQAVCGLALCLWAGAEVSITTTAANAQSSLVSISTRARVQTVDNVMIGGFFIGGTTPKTVLIRARGGSLGGAPFNNAGVLANPNLQLYSGSTVIAQNDNWQTTDPLCGSPATACGTVAQITATGLDPCQPNPGQTVAPPGCAQEAALYMTLLPGGYTAIVTGVGGTVGMGLVEVLEVGASASPLISISTRARVETGDNVMIGGIWIGGSDPKTVMIRARGGSLGGAPFNNPGVLANPTIQMFSGSTVIAQNDNWQTTDPLCGSPATACGSTAQITATGLDPCQPNPGQTVAPPGCAQESALLVTLPPGGYTAIVSGVGGTSGMGLVEVFDAAPPSVSINSVVVTEGNAGTTTASLTVTVSHASASPVSVSYATADGTATAPSDYVAASGTLTIPANSTNGTINVSVKGDTLYEGDETFTVTLSAPTNATLEPGQETGTGTITNDDSAPTLTINNVSLPEGNAGTTTFPFVVTQSAVSGLTTTVDYETANGTATAPSDYVATSGTLAIPPGSTNGAINVAVNGDTVFEPNETFLVILSGPMMATATTAVGTGTILNDDAASDLGVTKDVSPNQGVTVGLPVTYTIVAINNGPDGATGVTVTDILPAGVTFGSAAWTGASTGNCSQSAGTVTCAIGNLANAASVMITIVVTPTAVGTITNTASVNGSQTDLVPGNNNASVTTTVGPPSVAGRLVALSTRARVQTGDNVVIGGFAIGGSSAKTVLIRARGPSLGTPPFNHSGVLTNPTLQLYSGSTAIVQNNDWVTFDPTCASPCLATIQVTNASAPGLTPCEPNPGQSVPPANCTLESAILVTLSPGGYTAIVSGVGVTVGMGLVEVFEMNAPASPLTSLSTRARVETGDNVMIGGFVVSGTTPKTVLIRARGGSLGGAPFNNSGVLANPTMQLYSGSTVIAQNDDWQTTDPLCLSPAVACGNANQISNTGADPCQPNPGQTVAPPGCALESAVVVTLAPGGYTAIVSGVGGTSGMGLVEAVELPQMPSPVLILP